MKRTALSPAIVVGCGIALGIVWLAALFMVADLAQSTLVLAGASALVGAVGGGLGAIWHNWSRLEATESLARAKHEAQHDPLTGLANRATLFAELETASERARRNNTVLGVLFLDLDRFKVINDSMGHEAGDELLRVVAARLKKAVRGSDLVARFGGDEFVVVCRDLLSQRSVLAVAEQIRASFAQPVSLNGLDNKVSTSIGIAIALSTDDRGPEELLRDADAAMYKAKRDRSHIVVFDDDQRQEVTRRHSTEQQLLQALEEDQLVVYYQPLVNIVERRIHGFEALVRWNHPTKGILGPDEFLPIATEIGIMARIGERVMREACAQKAQWNHLSPDAASIHMAVNLSEQQLLDRNLAASVENILQWSGIPADQLVLEIVEDIVVDHLNDLEVLTALRAMGVTLAIDDFGTGRSSLGYAKDFNGLVTTLKIDKTFVSTMETGSPDRAVVEAIIGLARAMDMMVVAEGVETTDQMTQLQALGVHIMQGYLFNRPVSASAIDPATWFQPRNTVESPIGDLSTPASERLGLSSVAVGRVLTASQARPPRRA